MSFFFIIKFLKHFLVKVDILIIQILYIINSEKKKN